jgi:hypothetical protein
MLQAPGAMMPPSTLRALVRRIEAAFRERHGLQSVSDDEFEALMRRPADQTPEEVAAVRVIRMCIAVRRDVDARGLDVLKGPCPALDRLRFALHAADADKITGAKVRASPGAQVTAKKNHEIAQARRTKIFEAAEHILRDEPRIKRESLAQMLEDQGHGGKDALVKILRELYRA